jgi:hypothetical protein
MIEKVSRNKSINLPFKYFDEQAFWCALSPNSFTDHIMACAPSITSPFAFPRLPAYICWCAITFAFPSYLIKISTLPFLPKLLPDFLAKTPTWSYLLLEILSDLLDDPFSCATDSNTHFPAFLGLHPLRKMFQKLSIFPVQKLGMGFWMRVLVWSAVESSAGHLSEEIFGACEYKWRFCPNAQKKLKFSFHIVHKNSQLLLIKLWHIYDMCSFIVTHFTCTHN